MKSFTTKEVATILMVSEDHVKHLARSGKLPAFKTSGDKGDWRFRGEDVSDFMQPRKKKASK